MIEKLTTEFRYFQSMPHNMRVLLITNMLYALVLPVVEIFMAAYIMRYVKPGILMAETISKDESFDMGLL